MPVTTVEQAYNQCRRITRSHYENFPVASILLPRRLRLPISVIYAYARSADDFADEGDLDSATRLARLDDYRGQLDRIKRGERPDGPVFIALADVIEKNALPLEPFYDLLTAFRMDVTKKRYADFAEVMHYCRYSANPVGRLVLHLSNEATPQNLQDSDALCSALQLINFFQDIDQDYRENGRIYLPQDEMQECGVTERDIRERRNSPALRGLLDRQIQRARELLRSGAPLSGRLPGRLGFEIRLTVQGGLRILAALSANRDDVYARPRLRRRDWLAMLWRALTQHGAL